MSKARSVSPRRRPLKGDQRVMVGIRITAAQKAELARLGGGSLVIGFDRALVAAVTAEARS